MPSSSRSTRFRRLGMAGTASAVALCLGTASLTSATAAGAGPGGAARAGAGAGGSVTLATPLTSPAAARGKAAVYTQPTTYDGIDKAPKTKPQPVVSTVLSQTGANPDVYVDEAGTAHIVWNEGRGDDSDAAYYCRLKRAAKACDATAVLVWDKTYGAGDGPQYNTDDDGPRIVRVGDQLLVLSHRYPTVADKPDGASSSTTIGWVSNDGGSTWSPAGGAILGKRSLGQLAVVDAGNSPAVVDVGYDPLCGGMCLTAYRSGSYQGAEGVINADPTSNYYGTVANTSIGLIAGMADAGGRMWLKQWNGAEPITSPANWATTSPALAGSEPDLATGPSGTFLLSRVGLTGGRRVNRLEPGFALTNPMPITKTGGTEGVLDEDPGGGLRAVWADSGVSGGLHMRTATSPAAGFGTAQTLLTGDLTGQPALSATNDGGGFVVANATGGLSNPGRITAVAVGSQAPTGKPGLGDLPGGGNVSCTTVGFGSFDLQTVSGCFLKGIGDAKGMVVTEAPVTLNGLTIEPLPGAEVVIDPAKLRIDTIGQARVLLRDGATDVVLFQGVIHRDLSAVTPGTPLFEFPQADYAADVLGFPVAAGVQVLLTADGVRVPVEIRLPSVFGGFTGKATLIGQTGTGLRLDSLHVSVGPVPLGVAVLDNVSLDWAFGGTWTGSGKLTVPAGGTITAQIKFISGDFASADFSYQPDPPITIGPFVYLTSIGGGFALQPDLQVRANASIGAGAPVQGLQPVRIDGQFTMTFPQAGPGRFQVNADVDLLGLTIGQGNFRFLTSGYAAFDGGSSIQLGPVSGSVQVNGFVDATGGQFGATASGKLQICAVIEDPTGILPDAYICGGIGADLAVSSIGFAACASLDSPFGGTVSVGLEQRWSDLDPGVFVSPILLTAQILEAITLSCDTSPYAIAPPARSRAAAAVRAAGGAAFTVPSGLPSATFLVPGQGGTPEISVTGPGGRVLVGPGASSSNVRLVTLPNANAQWVVITKPQGGTYTVSPTATSVPLDVVKVSHGFQPAKVSGSVHGRVIHYAAKHLSNGQRITFRERGTFGTNILGSVRKQKGTFRIRPAAGPGGKRVVEALITHDGVTKKVVRLGTYRAPSPPTAGKATHLVVTKNGTKVKVSFRPGKHAARTQVVIKGNQGSRVARMLRGSKHRFTVSGFTWDTVLVVTVTTYGPDGRKGAVTKQRIRVSGPR